MACPFLQTGMVPAPLLRSGWKWDVEEVQPLPDPWIPPPWYLPTGTLVHATEAVKGTFQPPQPLDDLLCSLQMGAAMVLWGQNGHPGR